MIIVVAATDRQWNELIGTPAKTEWIRVSDGSAFKKNTEAAAFLNLQDDAHLFNYADLKKPVFINSVTHTLQQLNTTPNVLRINGWAGFLQRPVWEIAGSVDDTIIAIVEGMHKKITVVKDEPGLIAARIISMIINEAYFALGDNVSTKPDIDTAMQLGTNYPFGPFEWAERIGLDNILTLLQQLSLTDTRYRPADRLVAEATTPVQ